MKLNPEYISDKTKAFVREHISSDVRDLALKAHRYKDLPMGFIIDQVQSLQKIKKKLPNWYENEDLVFPKALSAEQCSSEVTAEYKSQLMEGESLIDMTGGLGVDAYAFSKKIQYVTYCEKNEEVFECATHNFEVLEASNVSCKNKNSLEYLIHKKFSWIYLDPARRDDSNQKVFRLEDCEPNILEHLDLLLEHSENILIKASPLLGIEEAITQLKGVREVHVVAVENDCKEVLLVLENGYEGEIRYVAVNHEKGGWSEVGYTSQDEKELTLSEPLKYIYEPNVSVLKSKAYQYLCNQFGVKKLHQNSHLFTSETLVTDFPGRKFELKEVCAYNKKELLKYLPTKKANITVRNFLATVSDIRKKTGLKDGGEDYLFATQLMNGDYRILLTKKAFDE